MDRRDAIRQTSLLLGSALSTSVITGIMQGCKPTYAVDWQPIFLSPEQAVLVGEIAETILPQTDTPGAKALHLDEFIDLMVGKAFTSEEQQSFTTGLQQLDEQCRQSQGKSIAELGPEQRLAYLQAEEERLLAGSAASATPKPALLQLKELTLVGYFTSEHAGKEMLVFKPVPGHYHGCVDYDGGPAQIGMRI